jgi:hypothetical protein
MHSFSLRQLEDFVVAAKAATYAGDGESSPPCREQSHDLEFHDGDFCYLDSYFGGTDFIGEEVVHHRGEPVWAMNYYGRILQPDLIDAAAAGRIIKAALSAMYRGGRFLGGYRWVDGEDVYLDRSEGDVTSFTGRECITRRGVDVYDLVYHGGLIKG